MTWNADYYAHCAEWEEADIDRRNANGDSCYSDYDTSEDWALPTGYKYQFFSDEHLITSGVFQRCLGQSLAHKDKEIEGLRKEIYELLEIFGGVV